MLNSNLGKEKLLKITPISNQFKEFIGMYRWLSREFTTVECTRTCE